MNCFFEFHPELLSACSAVAKEVTQSRNPVSKKALLKEAVWNQIDVLTQTLFTEPTPGAKVDQRGFFLPAAHQQMALDEAVKQVFGADVKAPRVGGSHQLKLNMVMPALIHKSPVKTPAPGSLANVLSGVVQS